MLVKETCRSRSAHHSYYVMVEHSCIDSRTQSGGIAKHLRVGEFDALEWLGVLIPKWQMMLPNNGCVAHSSVPCHCNEWLGVLTPKWQMMLPNNGCVAHSSVPCQCNT